LSLGSTIFKALCLLFVALLPVRVSAGDLPYEQQSALMLRILAYDRNLDQRVDTQVNVVVLYEESQPDSVAEARAIEAALREIGRSTTVAGYRLETYAHPYRGAVAELDYLSRLRATAVYLCSGMGGHVTEITGVTQSLSVMSFSGVDAWVHDGLGIGLVERGGRARIVVNLPAARAEGADLDAGLLRHSEVLQ
jgi:hypothetical protein